VILNTNRWKGALKKSEAREDASCYVARKAKQFAKRMERERAQEFHRNEAKSPGRLSGSRVLMSMNRLASKVKGGSRGKTEKEDAALQGSGN